MQSTFAVGRHLPVYTIGTFPSCQPAKLRRTAEFGQERTSLEHIRTTLIPPPELPQSQFAALLSSPAPARFKHFIGRAADCERLWGLRDATGWVSLADDTGAPGFPVWPHPDYAQACATEAWAGCLPAEINVHDFVEQWLPDMTERTVAVTVFATPSMKGIWMRPDELQRYLAEELTKYE
jgi:hypothetical protein